MRCRHRLSKLLLRHGIRFDDGRRGLNAIATGWRRSSSQWPAAQATLLDCQGAIDALAHRRDALEREIVALVPDGPWAVQVGRLRCLRGIDTLTAVGLCAEIGDVERFARAEQLMSYIRLVPSESTTGQQRRLGSITKTGLDTPAGCWSRPHGTTASDPRSARRSERQHGQPPEAVAIAWSAQQRLHRIWTRLDQRAKRRTIIAIAAARELAGFAWGDQPNRMSLQRPPTPDGWVDGGPARAGNPRRSYEQPAPGPATLDARQRHPTTNHGPAEGGPAPNPRISVPVLK